MIIHACVILTLATSRHPTLGSPISLKIRWVSRRESRKDWEGCSVRKSFAGFHRATAALGCGNCFRTWAFLFPLW